METPGSGYLYTVAMLAMTFVGFCAVVFVLRQGRPKKRAGFHVVHSHGYIEIALGSVAAAMLPPLLSVCEVPSLTIWQWSSAIIAAGFAAHTFYILERFYRIIGWRFPVHVWINTIITVVVIAALVANAIGIPLKPGVGPIAVAATWRLAMAIEIFLLTLEEFL
jgi:hypothetical protein